MSTSSRRQSEIIALARETGRVGVDDMAGRFGVTPQTIRRDLHDLCGQRMLTRVHGGAMIASGVQNLAYDARRLVAQPHKRLIGEATARLVPAQSSLFINIGTTTEAVARALTRHDDLSIITNNLHVATMLAEATTFRVLVAGGSVRRDGAVLGQLALEGLSQFRADYAVIGCSGIDADGSVLDFDFEEVRAAQAIIANAKTVFLVADHSKFSRRPMVRVGSLKQVHTLFTDRPPPAEVAALMERAGVRLAVAG